jgi:hypothetical protein
MIFGRCSIVTIAFGLTAAMRLLEYPMKISKHSHIIGIHYRWIFVDGEAKQYRVVTSLGTFEENTTCKWAFSTGFNKKRRLVNFWKHSYGSDEPWVWNGSES